MMRPKAATSSAVRIDDRVLDLVPVLPGCAGFVLLALAARSGVRVPRTYLMVYVGRGESAVRRAVTELAQRKLCAVDEEGRVTFTPEGLDG